MVNSYNTFIITISFMARSFGCFKSASSLKSTGNNRPISIFEQFCNLNEICTKSTFEILIVIRCLMEDNTNTCP